MLWIPVYLQTIMVLPVAGAADLVDCAKAPGEAARAAEVTAADSKNSRRENFMHRSRKKIVSILTKIKGRVSAPSHFARNLLSRHLLRRVVVRAEAQQCSHISDAIKIGIVPR